MAGLPEVPGPKLYPFDTGGEPLNLEFIEEIGKGLVSFVWKVRINGSEYALKIFTYYRLAEETYGVEFTTYEEEHAKDYFQPFQNECRAFGRLKEFGMEHLGVRCHGYITLNETQLAFMRSKYDFDLWDFDQEYDENEPVRAIVKDIVYMGRELPEKEYIALHITPKTVPKMVNDLKSMHQLGICISDIAFQNYIHNKFVDLSHAWTVPHPLLIKGEDPYEFPPLRRATNDAWLMDDFIDIWNEHNPRQIIWRRLLPERSLHLRLRPRERKRKVCWRYRPEEFTYESAAKIFKIDPLKFRREDMPLVEGPKAPKAKSSTGDVSGESASQRGADNTA